MKTVRIQGGLGNQLFCAAFAHSVAMLSGGPVALDVGGYGADRYGHSFLLHALAQRFGAMPIVSHPLLSGRLLAEIMRRAPIGGYVSEGAPPADAEALRRLVAQGRYFNGYWQAEAFMAAPDVVRRETRAFLDQRCAKAERHGILIHYRTYTDEIHPGRRGAPGADFVQRALDAIAKRVGGLEEVALISDQPDVALQRLAAIGRKITSVATGDADADMALMLRARALVLSNSSFSWWGGFCGDAETVIYPTRGGLFHYPTPAARFVCV